MLADDVNRTRLRPVRGGFLGEPDFVTGLELVEVTVDHAVAMKVDFTAVGTQDRTAVRHRHDLDNLAVGRLFVVLDVTALPARESLQLATHGIERVVHRDVRVFVCLVPGRIAPDDEFLAGKYR